MNALKIQYQTLARYNQAMNTQIFAACARLSDEQRKRDGAAWFKSIHGTLNHILLTDKVWLSRFGVEDFTAPSLDFELFADWNELSRERAATDAKLIDWIDNLEADKLREDLSFAPMSRPGVVTWPLWLVVSHVWNHQTHHRGQATTLMEALGADSGATDLPALDAVQQFVRENPL